MIDIEQANEEMAYVVADLAEGPWHERIVGCFMRWVWKREYPRIKALPESRHTAELRRLGIDRHFLPGLLR